MKNFNNKFTLLSCAVAVASISNVFGFAPSTRISWVGRRHYKFGGDDNTATTSCPSLENQYPFL
jgi:hypothetical protein